jgi:hypothetical protein
MMGVVPAHRRGIAAGARTLLQNTGAVLSIAFVMAIVTSAVPQATLFAIFSGVAKGLTAAKLDPFIANMHIALWVLAAVSLVGMFVCMLRPAHVQGEPGVSVAVEVGDAVAEAIGARQLAEDSLQAGPSSRNGSSAPTSIPAGRR